MQNFSVVRNNPYCSDMIHTWQRRMQCRRQVYDDMTIHEPEAMEECLCYPPCNDMEYDSSYSLSTLPDDPEENTAFYVNINQYTETLDESKKQLLASKFGGISNIKKGMMKHMSRLNVHIADNNIMKTTESPDYEAIRLVSDIGGQLGLWIGISVMTLFEVLQLIADVFRYLTSKGRHVGEKVNVPNTITGSGPMKRTYGNGDRFRHNERDIELTCEIDKLTTV
ncbi:hypothetical protein LSH36_317g03027 [Paralvinella palmiformis]|uniref:Uncharacterized protein n=1 Tax=Paralvinella palmiformis TaxID=53620 RepID=A0AAD9N122_9ANNE|nr:hypothetical protein LSH36_317g03027 [Paralvinella palmiformis]